MRPNTQSNDSINRSPVRLSYGKYQERKLLLTLSIIAIVLAVFALTQMSMAKRFILLSMGVVAGVSFWAMAKYIVYSAQREKIERDEHCNHGHKPVE